MLSRLPPNCRLTNWPKMGTDSVHQATKEETLMDEKALGIAIAALGLVSLLVGIYLNYRHREE